MKKTAPFCLLLIVLALAVSPSRADDLDHDAARRALEEGRVAPLAEITEKLKAQIPGEIIEVELDREDGRYIYEFKLVRPEGRVQEVEVDAKTGEILDLEDED
ncbi:PepSY domain-containing protein [Methyloligella sp. 2.7D]|uniref:PepSY domain-containing protein n=1 Tax=unclassified Methyloligella TaxID=2625955 RepID=UPI00157BC527|nr:PepSY domain-containing protein [Methyloligella sp. GL2]QKP78403.1 PepSY domain-containing protein [Methyloligella sp. GL2]